MWRWHLARLRCALTGHQAGHEHIESRMIATAIHYSLWECGRCCERVMVYHFKRNSWDGLSE